MARTTALTLVFFLVAGATGPFLPNLSDAASCDAIIGKWAWFIGGEVTVNRDGTFTQQSGNAGTWECQDGARGRFTFRWRDGGFVNSLVLSPDGQGLSSTDQSQLYVTAQRSGPAPQPQPVRPENCCQEAYACETKRIEAEFDQKLAQCHFPGNASCNAEAVRTKAAQLQAANEALRSCNRAASGAGTRPVPGSGGAAATAAGNDEFHSTERPGFFSPECACETASDQGHPVPQPNPPDGPLPWEQPAQAQSPGSCDPTTIQGGIKDEWDDWNRKLAGAISDEFQKHTAEFRSQYGGERVPLKVTIRYYVQGPPTPTMYRKKKLAYGIYISTSEPEAIPFGYYNLTQAQLKTLQTSFTNLAKQALYATMASYQSRLKFPEGAQCPNGRYEKTGVFSNDPTAPGLIYDDRPTRRY